MDSTIIKEESLDEIAEDAGIGDEIKNITKKAMKGELDFKDALLKRINLLKNYPLENIFTLNPKIRFNDGAKELVRKMKSKSCITVLISGGFSPSISYIAKRIGLITTIVIIFYTKNIIKKLYLMDVSKSYLDKNSKLNITKFI